MTAALIEYQVRTRFCDGGSSLVAIHGVFVPFVNRDGDALGSWNEGFIYENLCVVGIGWIWIWKEINSNIHKNIRVEFDPLLSFELRSRALAGSRMLFWLVSIVSRVHSAAVTSPDDEYILTGDTGPALCPWRMRWQWVGTLWHDDNSFSGWSIFLNDTIILSSFTNYHFDCRVVTWTNVAELKVIFFVLTSALSRNKLLHNCHNCCPRFSVWRQFVVQIFFFSLRYS